MDSKNKENIIEEIARTLDISFNMYRMAESRTRKIADHINKEYPQAEIFLQGSFRYGTMIRPYHKDKEGDYDMDLIVKYSGDMKNNKPEDIKKRLGDILTSSPYEKFLDNVEGRRCWTLNYEDLNDSGEKISFHIDLLPSVSETLDKDPLAYTNKDDDVYTWGISDPIGYAKWFENINIKKYSELITSEVEKIYTEYSSEFKGIEEVSDMHVRTPLQRVIQILKRHRDVMFANDSEDKPISMIITTCVSKIVDRDSYTYNKTYELLNLVLAQLESNKDNYRQSGKWSIPNPVDGKENLADKWNEEGSKAEAYFKWLKQAKIDLIDILEDSDVDIRKDLKRSLGFTDEQISSLNLEVEGPKPFISGDKTPKPYSVS